MNAVPSTGLKAIADHTQILPADIPGSDAQTKEECQVLEIVDPGIWTHRVCTAGIALIWLTGLSSIVYGSVIQAITDRHPEVSSEPTIGVSRYHDKIFTPLIQLSLSFLITVCSDVAGLVHATSLRFALLREGKLEFNSNLRLFTHCKTSRIHSRWANVLWAWFLISCYACGSMVLVDTVYTPWDDENTPRGLEVVSGYALIVLGFSLLGQASIATWALFGERFPTYSTDPLQIAAIGKAYGWLRRSSKRSLLSVHDVDKPELRDVATLPKSWQVSLFKADRRVLRSLIWVWVVTILSFLWFTALAVAYQFVDRLGPSWQSFTRSFSNDWSIIPNYVDTTPYLAVPTSIGHEYFTFGPWLLCKYLFTCVFVAGFTLTLHVCELIVQTSRDESLWRQTASRHGLRFKRQDAIPIALCSWQTVLLFVFKTVVHWMFSLAFGIHWEGVELRLPQVCYTAVILFVLALLATGLALYKPRGPQPATFGHLQTLVDLIDVWPCRVSGAVVEGDDVQTRVMTPLLEVMDQRALYWGDKGEDGEGFRRAGTSFAPLPPIVRNALYF